MNTTLNGYIIERTIQLFKNLFQMDIQAETPSLISPESAGSWEISGIISVTGTLNGLVSMRYKKELADIMLKNALIYNMDSEFQYNILADMIGEVTNIIAGNVLTDDGIEELLLSIPITIHGEDHEISWPRDTRITAIPFRSGEHSFVIQTGLK
ncbi:MAG: chemotaxis protein CheX [Spirochaetales bacterium]|nr:chemotaxis protein CheX [Spirochaetales bacterium]